METRFGFHSSIPVVRFMEFFVLEDFVQGILDGDGKIGRICEIIGQQRKVGRIFEIIGHVTKNSKNRHMTNFQKPHEKGLSNCE